MTRLPLVLRVHESSVPPNNELQRTKPVQAMELRSLSPVLGLDIGRGHYVPSAAPGEAEIHAVLTALSETPKEIARITRGCSDRHLHRKPDAQAWSAQEIVAHLRACAEVWGRSIERMLAEDHPTMRYVSPRGWIKRTDYFQQSFQDSLGAFSHRRTELVQTLSELAAVEWSRGATFTATTVGRAATVLSYARRIADHEAQHLGQLRRTVKR